MKYLLTLGFLLLTALASAQEPLPVVPAEEEANLLQIVGDRFYLETTEGLISLSENLDSFFPNPENRRFDYRQTRIQAQAGLQVDGNGKILALQRFSGRVVLPRLEERLSLYFSGAGEDLNRTEEDDTTSNLFFLPNLDDTRFRLGFNTALRYVFTKSNYYLVQNQLGVRLLPEWDPYNEISGLLRIPFGKFLWQPGQSLYWRESSGLGETTRYDLDYALGHGAIIRLHQEGMITQKSNGYTHMHSLAFLHQLSESRGYAFALEARGETFPVQRMTRYLVGFTWKELVYEDWLYIETGTNLLFAREDSFEPMPAIFFSLICDFNGKKGKPRPSLPREERPTPVP